MKLKLWVIILGALLILDIAYNYYNNNVNVAYFKYCRDNKINEIFECPFDKIGLRKKLFKIDYNKMRVIEMNDDSDDKEIFLNSQCGIFDKDNWKCMRNDKDNINTSMQEGVYYNTYWNKDRYEWHQISWFEYYLRYMAIRFR